MVGDLVMDRFRLLERIGAGGMGTVYRAFDERLQRFVAVKEVEITDPERVRREARAAARLNHPGIVTLYEFGTQGNRALLVSELVAGRTVAELVDAAELSDRDIAEIGADVADALVHAHACGVVHRDIKPQNVIVRGEDGAGHRAKLMDFGIARVAGTPTLTASGEVVGTLAYMAPEQADGRGAGPEADVYSLALTLYECWAGENPVRRETPAMTARRIGAELPALREYRPDLPARLADGIDACLAPDSELRPTPAQVATALERDMNRLDDVRSVPARIEGTAGEPAVTTGLVIRIALALAVAFGLATVAGPGDRPGAALIAAVVALPGLLLAMAPAGALRRSGALRASLGVLGWFALGSLSIVLDIAPHLATAPEAWSRSVSAAADGVLAPLFEPDALLGAIAFGAGALTIGWIVRAPHVAIALLGALLWSAGLAAAMRPIGDGTLGSQPVVIAIVAAVAVGIAFAGRARGSARRPRRAPTTLNRPDLARPV
jgi:hypothetical protein